MTTSADIVRIWWSGGYDDDEISFWDRDGDLTTVRKLVDPNLKTGLLRALGNGKLVDAALVAAYPETDTWRERYLHIYNTADLAADPTVPDPTIVLPPGVADYVDYMPTDPYDGAGYYDEATQTFWLTDTFTLPEASYSYMVLDANANFLRYEQALAAVPANEQYNNDTAAFSLATRVVAVGDWLYRCGQGFYLNRYNMVTGAFEACSLFNRGDVSGIQFNWARARSLFGYHETHGLLFLTPTSHRSYNNGTPPGYFPDAQPAGVWVEAYHPDSMVWQSYEDWSATDPNHPAINAQRWLLVDQGPHNSTGSGQEGWDVLPTAGTPKAAGVEPPANSFGNFSDSGANAFEVLGDEVIFCGVDDAVPYTNNGGSYTPEDPYTESGVKYSFWSWNLSTLESTRLGGISSLYSSDGTTETTSAWGQPYGLQLDFTPPVIPEVSSISGSLVNQRRSFEP